MLKVHYYYLFYCREKKKAVKMFFLYLHLSQSVLQILRICFSTGLSYALVLFLSAKPRVERHNLILVLLVLLQQS